MAEGKNLQEIKGLEEWKLNEIQGKLTQEDGYVYRGFCGEPDLNKDGSIIFKAHKDSLFADNGITDSPVVAFSPDILVAREYAVAQYKIFQNDGRHISDPEESDMYYDRLRKEGYTLIKVKLADITNESLTNGKEEIIFKEDVTIPKGSYQFSHLFEDSEGCRHIMDERDNLRDQKEFIEEGINYKNNMEISIEAKLNHSEVTYPNSSEKLWNRPPYSVRVDVGGEDEFYIKSILIKNGNGKGMKFNVNDNNVLFDMEDMTVKYGLTNGKTEFIPHPKESEEVDLDPVRQIKI